MSASAGSPEGYVSPLFHDDAAAATAAALGVPTGIYNVADDEPLRQRAHSDALADTLGVAPPRLPLAWLAPVMGAAGNNDLPFAPAIESEAAGAQRMETPLPQHMRKVESCHRRTSAHTDLTEQTPAVHSRDSRFSAPCHHGARNLNRAGMYLGYRLSAQAGTFFTNHQSA